MTDYNRLLAGAFTGIGAIYLIMQGNETAGVALLASLMAFFVGETNGKRSATQNKET